MYTVFFISFVVSSTCFGVLFAPIIRSTTAAYSHRLCSVAYPEIFFGGGGVQQIQLRTEGRENMDLGAVAP
jgi:hypothetical protein